LIQTKFIIKGKFDEIVIATGILPRQLSLEGINHPKVLSYIEVIRDKKPVGKKVAIIGAGGIGFDTAEYLLHDNKPDSIEAFQHEWGIDGSLTHRGGIVPAPAIETPLREIYLCQRTSGKLGKKLGKTTGWIHRMSLKMHKVKMLSGVSYDKIDDIGLHYTKDEKQHVLEVDNVVICAGQVSYNKLAKELNEHKIPNVHIIGGAFLALELDAKYAINQGSRLAATF
jgi:2,4-dienoyl-CoA reductase (NADPH2)